MTQIYLKPLAIVLLLTAICTTTFAQTQIKFHTNMGEFIVEMREDLVPITAGNFITLTDSGFYDGVIFHRIIDGFMIQGGDPLGTGFGGPGYTIPDEFHMDLRHDGPGIISMANAGPNTGGSQFFITLDETDWLDDKHSVFGKVISGMNVVEMIGSVDTDPANDRPLDSVVMDSLRVFDPVASLPVIKTGNAQVRAPYPNDPAPNRCRD